MKNVKRLTQSALTSALALVGFGMAPFAAAAGNLDAHLRGSYAFTAVRTCTALVAPHSFVPPSFAIPPNVPAGALFRQSASDAGIITFNGDGTGTASGTSRVMNITTTGAGTPPVSVSEFTNAIEYTVNADGTVDTATTSDFTLVFPTGPTGMVTGQVNRLQIAGGNTMLVSAPSGDPIVETITFSGVPVQSRLCVRSTTAVKLPGG
jgi:hypothetical protein